MSWKIRQEHSEQNSYSMLGGKVQEKVDTENRYLDLGMSHGIHLGWLETSDQINYSIYFAENK